MEIVVPLDHSTLAERAVGIAHGISCATGATIRLVTVVDEADAESALGYLRSVAATHLRGLGAAIEVLPSRAGVTVAERILAAVEESSESPAVLCMSSHGRSGFGVAVLGGTAEEVLRSSAHPVVVIGRRCDLPWPGNRRAIVLPVDGSPRWREIVPVVQGIIRWTYLEPVLVEVSHTYDTAEPEPPAALDAARCELAGCGLDAKAVHRFGSNIPVTICEAARDWGAAIMAMSVDVGPRPSSTLLGTVTARAIRDAPCPVVVSARNGVVGGAGEVW